MREDIEQLVALQKVELERRRLQQELTKLPATIAAGAAELAAAEKAVATAEKALADEEALRAKADQQIAAHRQKATKLRQQMDQATTTAQVAALENETSFADSEAERLESEEFASLERSEAAEAALVAAREAVGIKTIALEKIRKRAKERDAEYNATIVELAGERDALRQKIDENMLMRFDRLMASRGSAIAQAIDQHCHGCRMGVRPQMWYQLREGELLNCEGCGRLLYWDPSMAPATEN